LRIQDAAAPEGKYALLKYPDGDNEVRAITSILSFPVTLSPPSTRTVTVAYATVAGTATQGLDYIQTSGTLTFKPGETRKKIRVLVVGDTTVEPNETFSVRLSSASGAAVSRTSGRGTIVNDDL
jgi:hypothetical protein